MTLSALLLGGCTSDLDFGASDAAVDGGEGGVSPLDGSAGEDAAPDGDARAAFSLTSSSPESGASDVSVATGLQLRFDREVEAGEGAFLLLEALDAIVVDEVPAQSDQVEFDGRDVFVDWSWAIEHATTYTVVIQSGAVVDAAGNRFEELTQPGSFTFSTADPEPIRLLSTDPETGADDVPLDTPLVLTFDAEIALGPVGDVHVIEAVSGDVVYSRQLSDNPDVAMVGTRLRLTLPEPLEYGTEYYVVLDSDVVRSTAGASYEGFDDEQFFTFSTQPPPQPRLISTAPLDDATDVDPDANLVLIFDQPVLPGSGTLSVHEVESRALVEVFDVAVDAVTFSDVSVTLDPSMPLAPTTEYYVRVDEGAILSTLGASYPGLDDLWTFNFTTAAEPPPPVTMVGSVPAPDADDVPADTDVVLIFSEVVAARSGSVTVFRASDDEVFESVPIDDGRVRVAGDTVTVDLDRALQDNTEYYVTIGAGTLVSARGASFSGVLDPTLLRFKTDDPFVVVSRSPADGAHDVDVRTELVLTFSAPAQPGSGELVVRSSDVFEVVPIPDGRVRFDDEEVRVDLRSTLSYDTSYSVTLSAGAVVEVGGQGFSGISASGAWSFSTTTACDSGESLGNNGNCYQVRVGAGSEATWSEARQACRNRGDDWDLAAIDSMQDQAAITALLDAVAPGAQLWVGGSDSADEGSWIWVNSGRPFWEGGVSGDAVAGAFSHWKSDQPSGVGQNCARLVPEDGDYLWADTPCDDRHGFLCQGPTN